MTGREERWGDEEGRNPEPRSASLPPTLMSPTSAQMPTKMRGCLLTVGHSLAPRGIARGRNLKGDENSLGQTEDQHLVFTWSSDWATNRNLGKPRFLHNMD